MLLGRPRRTGLGCRTVAGGTPGPRRRQGMGRRSRAARRPRALERAPQRRKGGDPRPLRGFRVFHLQRGTALSTNPQHFSSSSAECRGLLVVAAVASKKCAAGAERTGRGGGAKGDRKDPRSALLGPSRTTSGGRTPPAGCLGLWAWLPAWAWPAGTGPRRPASAARVPSTTSCGESGSEGQSEHGNR